MVVDEGIRVLMKSPERGGGGAGAGVEAELDGDVLRIAIG